MRKNEKRFQMDIVEGSGSRTNHESMSSRKKECNYKYTLHTLRTNYHIGHAHLQ